MSQGEIAVIYLLVMGFGLTAGFTILRLLHRLDDYRKDEHKRNEAKQRRIYKDNKEILKQLDELKKYLSEKK